MSTPPGPATDWRFEALDPHIVEVNPLWGCDGVPGLCGRAPTVVGYSAQLNMRARLCPEHHRRALDWLELQRETGP